MNRTSGLVLKRVVCIEREEQTKSATYSDNECSYIVPLVANPFATSLLLLEINGGIL